MASLSLSHRNWPRILNYVNDNYCVKCVTGLKDCACVSGQIGLNPSPVMANNRDLTSKSETVNLLLNYCVASAHSVIKLPQKKGVIPNYCHNYTEIKIFERGYTLPFQFRPNLTRSPADISNYVNPHKNLHLLEVLYQLVNKNAVELVANQKSLGFYNWLFLVPKPNINNWWRPILDLSTLNTFLNTESFKIETPETKYLPTGRGVGHLHRFQGRILPHTNSQSVQEVHAFSCAELVLPVQSTTLWPVHSTHGVHSGGQRGQTDGFTEGYKNPPVSRRLVGESHIPPKLSPAYTDLGSSVSRTRLAGEQGKVRTGSKTGFQLHRLPVQPKRGQGQTHTRALAGLNRQDSVNTVQSGVSGPAVHVPHRSTHSNRKASPPSLAPYETHTVALEKQLGGHRIT